MLYEMCCAFEWLFFFLSFFSKRIIMAVIAMPHPSRNPQLETKTGNRQNPPLLVPSPLLFVLPLIIVTASWVILLLFFLFLFFCLCVC